MAVVKYFKKNIKGTQTYKIIKKVVATKKPVKKKR